MESKLQKTAYYRLQFIENTRFMIISLSNLGDNLAKGIHKINCKSGHVDKKCETCGIKY